MKEIILVIVIWFIMFILVVSSFIYVLNTGAKIQKCQRETGKGSFECIK